MAQDDFSKKIKAALGMRAAFQCSICGAPTVGPSRRAPDAVINIGVAAHIAGARAGSARFDPTMTSEQRSAFENGIWLCQTHAKEIDDDEITWPVAKLRETKNAHEKAVRQLLGVATKRVTRTKPAENGEKFAQKYGFVRVGEMIPAYRGFLQPLLVDKHLGLDAELGVLMTSLAAGRPPGREQVQWTVFVDPDWLRKAIAGSAETGADGSVPDRVIYGRVPGWPDEFLEFLAAIVESGVTFRWQRTPQGHLALAQ